MSYLDNEETNETEIEYYGFTRPFCLLTILFLSKFNNIHIMTRSEQVYAEQILEKTKLNKYILNKKYREDCEDNKNLECFEKTQIITY